MEFRAWQVLLHWRELRKNLFHFAKTKSHSEEVLLCGKCLRIRWKIANLHLMNIFQIFIWKRPKNEIFRFCTSWFSEKKCVDRACYFTFKWQSFQTNDLSCHKYGIEMRLKVYDFYFFAWFLFTGLWQLTLKWLFCFLVHLRRICLFSLKTHAIEEKFMAEPVNARVNFTWKLMFHLPRHDSCDISFSHEICGGIYKLV